MVGTWTTVEYGPDLRARFCKSDRETFDDSEMLGPFLDHVSFARSCFGREQTYGRVCASAGADLRYRHGT